MAQKSQGKQEVKRDDARDPQQQNQKRQPGSPMADPDVRKPTEREGRPEMPRKDQTQVPGAEPDRAQPSRSGNALPDRGEKDDRGAEAGSGSKQRDTLHIPSRTNRP